MAENPKDLRDSIINAVKEELIGPSEEPAYQDADTGEEVLLHYVHGAPKGRYGAGMLYPRQSLALEYEHAAFEDADLFAVELDTEPQEDAPELNNASSAAEPDDVTEDAVGLANEYLPSALGLTCRLNQNLAGVQIKVVIEGAHYVKLDDKVALMGIRKRNDQNDESKPRTENNPQPAKNVVINPRKIEALDKESIEVEIKNKTTDAWVRRPFRHEETIELSSILHRKRGKAACFIYRMGDGTALVRTDVKDPDSWVSLEIYKRSGREKDHEMATFTLTNLKSVKGGSVPENGDILFQTKLSLVAESDGVFLPFGARKLIQDEDERQMELLYRSKPQFAVGHGCAATWNETEPVQQIVSSAMPEYEIPLIEPAAFDDLELSMYELSDKGNWDVARALLAKLADKYEAWIADQDSKVEKLDERYQETARNNMARCRDSLRRIRRGVNMLLESEADAPLVECFRWANRAMIWQQQRSRTPQRKWTLENGKWQLEKLPDNREHHVGLQEFYNENLYNGRWRPFQLAFVLMNLDAAWNADKSEDREIVDLIWFPTGGGKTEAYLGLSAFVILARRSMVARKLEKTPEACEGVTILMRYTLRLLTAQQFERASSLICGLELIRREINESRNNDRLGTEPISIGLWVGGTTTPNDQKEARKQFKKLLTDKGEPYHFVVLKCPACGAGIGKVDDNKTKKEDGLVKGLKYRDGEGIRFACENAHCDFHQEDELPVYVVDEDLYNKTPTLTLGTVDKFAMLAWKPETGKLFGFRSIENEHSYRIRPPELIIQDELHLISGPLGTIVGLYETLIQELCVYYPERMDANEGYFPLSKDEARIKPKIIASSATISQAAEQVKALYATERLNIFPAQGLQFGDTFFSREAPLSEKPGRRYVGISASGLSEQNAQVRTYAALLQAVKGASASLNAKDYYWTLVGFFNSIRALGATVSLIYSSIPKYMGGLQNRELLPYSHRRPNKYLHAKELTSRISSGEIPGSLKALERKLAHDNDRSTLDLCIATNMIATGVDVSRLGLMVVHGQPKTVAEYIQASSRVGRNTDGPGLVFTMYAPSKPRDKSVYEQFQKLHARIYADVEPTSVTPFSINARDRALHAVFIGLVRHFASGGDQGLRYTPLGFMNPANVDLRQWARNVIIERCRLVNPAESEDAEQMLAEDGRICNIWRVSTGYGDLFNKEIKDNPDKATVLMYSTMAELPDSFNKNSAYPTQVSMRNVDTVSEINVLRPER